MVEQVVIDTGDHVKHGPSGEEWTVAYVQNGYLSPCGWPEGEAKLSDCTLIEAATDEYRLNLLHELAKLSGPRGAYARWRLGIRETV